MRLTFAFPEASAADANALAVLISGPDYDGGFGPAHRGGWVVSSWEADVSALQGADGSWLATLAAPAWSVDLAAAQRAWATVDVDAPALTAGRAVLLVGMDGPDRLAAMISAGS